MARQTIQNANASLYFNGSSSLMTSPVVPSPTGFSFAMWMKLTNPKAGNARVMDYSDSGPSGGMTITVNAPLRPELVFYDGVSTTSALPITRSGWVHVAGTYVPNSAKLYINGELAVTDSIVNMSAPTQTLTFGRRSATSANFASVFLSQVVLHNTTTPWTAAQVLALYKSGTIPTGATAVYPLNEGGGSIAYDTSGNGNNGTITSGTWSRETPTKTRNKLDGIPYFNGDFETVPTFVAATTTGDGCVDGTAAGTTYSSPNKYGWQIFSWAGTYSAQFDTSERYSGTASMKLTLGATGSRIRVRRYSGTVAYSLNQERIPCNPSTEYTLKYWMKTSLSGSATSGANVALAQYRQNGITGAGASAAGTVVKTTTGWTQYTVTLTTNATARFIQPELNLTGDDGAATLIGSAWYDDIQLYPTTPVTRSAATGRLTATGRSAA